MSAVVLLNRCMHWEFASLISLREQKYQSITSKQSINQFLWNKNQSWTKISINYYEPKYQSITMKQSIDQLLWTKISIKLASHYFIEISPKFREISLKWIKSKNGLPYILPKVYLNNCVSRFKASVCRICI